MRTLRGLAQASLIHIGFATYDDGIASDNIGSYKLIYDTDLKLTWLDYQNDPTNWQSQMDWAASLNDPGELEYHFFSGITTNWASSVWRLPSAGSNPEFGYNQTGSEMGHLYYTELGNAAGGPLINTGIFHNLPKFGAAGQYWTGTHYASDPGGSFSWSFHWYYGIMTPYDDVRNSRYAGAVRSGDVAAVPIPGSIWLLGSGLAGLIGWRKKRRRLG